MRRLLLGLAVAATTLVPGVVSADDTQIADFIQTRLKGEQQQGNLRGFNVDMQVEKGTVWFRGTVSNSAQEMLILKTAQQAGHLGVVQVVDDIEVSSASIKPVAYTKRQDIVPLTDAFSSGQAFSPNPAPAIISPPMAQETFSQPMSYGDASNSSEPLPFASCSSCSGGMGGGQIISGGEYVDGGYSSGGYVGGGEPLAASTAGAGGPSGSPNLPGYAWPGYAAHPNYGAVSYPKQYSASAWPYIGPFYPYPQVPLGWRRVALEWDDGFWHLDFSDKSRH